MEVFTLKNIFAIIMVIIGSIIGAGFASGQEINSFFYKYGINRNNWNDNFNYDNFIYNI